MRLLRNRDIRGRRMVLEARAGKQHLAGELLLAHPGPVIVEAAVDRLVSIAKPSVQRQVPHFCLQFSVVPVGFAYRVARTRAVMAGSTTTAGCGPAVAFNRCRYASSRTMKGSRQLQHGVGEAIDLIDRGDGGMKEQSVKPQLAVDANGVTGVVRCGEHVGDV
jgi:hypothetical protein